MTNRKRYKGEFIMKLHERLYHLKVCEMDYTLLIKGIDKYILSLERIK